MARERYYITRNHPMLMGLQGTAVWISKYSSLSNALRDTLRPIDQELYAAKSLYHREPSVYFNGQNGISLDAIKRRDFSSLADKDESAFPTLSSPRPSLRIQLQGYNKHSSQVWLRSSTTRSQLAQIILREVIHVLEKREGRTDNATHFLRLGAQRLRLEDVFLVEVRHVSKASYQPLFMYRPAAFLNSMITDILDLFNVPATGPSSTRTLISSSTTPRGALTVYGHSYKRMWWA
ncbi:hypothetical protein POSPLADRAFT_1037546 [Postia placenta MAD-698-R-SB12]|uniref:Uncharacterized protein n=1 Tax=Postia placenta MAD-698-R-SB12 TaxID=670580 RepID=A0A1X6MIV8_9APHY|nr:hypothetical protein POSPLADRAFT_1037546 [Postia placenta MAD-698-R-SB12]OSX56249.1 hypothetical protein POSPLADRAFT_1037546 [Postia placenta MAD-698-R-SB12]